MPTDYSIKYLSQNQKIYQKYIDAIVRLSFNNTDPAFSLSKYPVINKKVNSLLKQMFDELKAVTMAGIGYAWNLSNKANDKLVNDTIVGPLSKAAKSRYYDQNTAKLDDFRSRKDNGLSITDRISHYVKQFKTEIELAVIIGFTTGQSTSQITKSVKQYQNRPDLLFKRAKDSDVNLNLSKYAKNYHPGQGIFRSSFKNITRLTADEVNMAYRFSDYERRQNLDFVRGIEVHLSKEHDILDVCDYLQGYYPKDYVFTGFHTRCLCYATSILMTDEEFNQTQELLLSGKDINVPSKNDVKNLPIGFTDWVSNNQDKLDNAKSLPYFLKYNPKYYKK